MFFKISPKGFQGPLCAPHDSVSLRNSVILVVLVNGIVCKMYKRVLDILHILVILLCGKPYQTILVQIQPGQWW